MMAKDALAVPQSNKCVSAGSPLSGQGRGPPSGHSVFMCSVKPRRWTTDPWSPEPAWVNF